MRRERESHLHFPRGQNGNHLFIRNESVTPGVWTREREERKRAKSKEQRESFSTAMSSSFPDFVPQNVPGTPSFFESQGAIYGGTPNTSVTSSPPFSSRIVPQMSFSPSRWSQGQSPLPSVPNDVDVPSLLSHPQWISDLYNPSPSPVSDRPTSPPTSTRFSSERETSKEKGKEEKKKARGILEANFYILFEFMETGNVRLINLEFYQLSHFSSNFHNFSLCPRNHGIGDRRKFA